MKLTIPISSFIRHMWVDPFDGLQPRDGIVIEHVRIYGEHYGYKVFFIHEDDYDIFTAAQAEEEFEILSLGEPS